MKMHVPAPFERPSLATTLQVALAAVTLGVLSYPFVFHAFGPGDNPFADPRELLAVGLLALCSVPVLVALVVIRRIIAPRISR